MVCKATLDVLGAAEDSIPYKILYHGARCLHAHVVILRRATEPAVRISENATSVFGGMFAQNSLYCQMLLLREKHLGKPPRPRLIASVVIRSSRFLALVRMTE